MSVSVEVLDTVTLNLSSIPPFDGACNLTLEVAGKFSKLFRFIIQSIIEVFYLVPIHSILLFDNDCLADEEGGSNYRIN